MIPFIYIALHIFIAFTTHIIGFTLGSKDGSCPEAENARNQTCCSFTRLPLTSCETLNKPPSSGKPPFPD